MQESVQWQQEQVPISGHNKDLAKKTYHGPATSEKSGRKKHLVFKAENSPIDSEANIFPNLKANRKRKSNEMNYSDDAKYSRPRSYCQPVKPSLGASFSDVKITLDEGVLSYRTQFPDEELSSLVFVMATLDADTLDYAIGVATLIGAPESAVKTNASKAIKMRMTAPQLKFNSALEAEISAIWRGIKDLEWLYHYRERMGCAQTKPGVVFSESSSAIEFIKNASATSPQGLWRGAAEIQRLITSNKVVLKYVPGEDEASGGVCFEIRTHLKGRQDPL
jgi:hypothetical protein